MKKRKKRLVAVSLLMIAYSTINLSAQKKVDSDEKLAQETAQYFVRRIQQTRDISPLIKELFLSDFISHFECDDETMPRSLYSQLSQSERFRLFVAQMNVAYMVSIDVLEGTDYIHKPPEETAFSGILSSEIAKRLRNSLARYSKSSQFSSYKEFETRLPKIENVLLESKRYLKKKGLEQTPEFQKKLDDTITGRGTNYKFSDYSIGESKNVCWTNRTLPRDTKIYRVETPLFFGILFAKVGKQMKIISIEDADDD